MLLLVRRAPCSFRSGSGSIPRHQSEELRLQATNNTKAQFGASPTLTNEILNAAMDAFAAHSSLSKQVLDLDQARQGLKGILLGPAGLYEALRATSA
jgi:type I restriction enzyme R subunit